MRKGRICQCMYPKYDAFNPERKFKLDNYFGFINWDLNSINKFKTEIKTYLFRQAFNRYIVRGFVYNVLLFCSSNQAQLSSNVHGVF